MERKKGGNGAPDPSDLIFIGYAHKSEQWLEPVRRPFKPAEKMGLIEFFSDKNIAAGEPWKLLLRSKMLQAKIAILLIDSHFLASEDCLEEEVPFLLERQEKGEIRIIPILVERCHWWLFPWLERLQIRTFGELALSELPRNRVQTHLSALAWEILESLGVEPPEQPDPDRPSPGSPAAILIDESGSMIRVLNARHRFGRARDVKDLAAFCALELRGGVPKLDGRFHVLHFAGHGFRKGLDAAADAFITLDDGEVRGFDVFDDYRIWVDGIPRLSHADQAGGVPPWVRARLRRKLAVRFPIDYGDQIDDLHLDDGHTRVALVTGLGFEKSVLLERLVRAVQSDEADKIVLPADNELIKPILAGWVPYNGDIVDDSGGFDVYERWLDSVIRLSRADRGGGPRREWVWLGEGMPSHRAFDRDRPPLDASAIAPELLIHQEAPARPRAWLHHELAVPFLFDPGDRFAGNALLTYLHVPEVSAAPAPGVGYQPLRNHVADPTFFGLPAIRKEIRINNVWDDDYATIGRIGNDDVDDTWVGSLPPGALIPGHVIYTSGHDIDTCRSTGELLPF